MRDISRHSRYIEDKSQSIIIWIYNTVATIAVVLISVLLHLSFGDDYLEGGGQEDSPSYKNTVYALLGSNLTFLCGISRDTARQGTWYYGKNGDGDKPINTTDFPKIKLSTYEMEITNVNYSDMGFYICKIEDDRRSYMEIKLNVGKLPSKATNISVEPLITNDEFSILEIEFGLPQIDGYERYIFEIVGINDMNSSTHEWQPAFNADSKKCCKIRYTHYGTSIGGLMRLAIANEYGKSEYIESGPFVFPNRPFPPFLRLKVVHEGKRKLYLEWEKQCEHASLFKSYKLRYRNLQFPLNWTTISIPKENSYSEIDVASDADYVFNLVGEGESQNYYSDQIYYHTKPQSPIVGKFEFTNISSKRLSVKFFPPSEFAGKNFSFEVIIHEGNATASKLILFPNSSDFLMNITNLKPNGAIDYKPQLYAGENFTENLYVKTLEDIPEAVTNLTTRFLPPTIRWKLNKLPDNLFFVEQCDTSYEIKVFYQDEHYSVFVSARTLAGYGPERSTSFKVGSPPDSPSVEDTIYAVKGTDVTLFCGKSAESAKKGDWYFRRQGSPDKMNIAKEVHANIDVHLDRLTIKGVTNDNEGHYLCQVRNKAYKLINLEVGELPNKAEILLVNPEVINNKYAILRVGFRQIEDDQHYLFEITALNDDGSSKNEWIPAFSAKKQEIDVEENTDYVFQLVARGNKTEEFYSEQLYHHTKYQNEAAGVFNFLRIRSRQLEVDFSPSQKYADKDFSFKLFIHKGKTASTPKNFTLQSKKKFPMKISLVPYEPYFIRVEYQPKDGGQDPPRFNTEMYYVRASEDLPEKVTQLTKRHLPPTKEYALKNVTWDAPMTKNGVILGYKVNKVYLRTQQL
ncbi:unnamed protein product [Cylicocyclus nassatus]|uniref:Ig-like domain-containing protein n=1 Tax=Cylicocyclus nassatus TaxID=53992 RepID=A0AA36GUL2_CYLNA|nr:unnamed protein product [Cylicocyclus nassatus]